MGVQFDTQVLLDALGHGVLIFDTEGKLEHHNLMAGTILGTDLNVIKTEGWSVAAELFDTDVDNIDLRLDKVREQALQSERPIRFKIFRSGNYIPCWASAINGEDGAVYLMLTLDVPDWELVSNVIDRFRGEMRDAVDSTIGHINLINRTLSKKDDDAATAKIAKRVGGFTRLIATHMSRAERLMGMLDRLQDIRTGKLKTVIQSERRKVDLEDFMEDFLELLDEVRLLDPESEPHDYRSRVKLNLQDDLYLHIAPRYLSNVLQEAIRNAIMYSLVGTAITIKAQKKATKVQIDIIDEGYGIREKEVERVFSPFSRARQPQIISEFGYGMALYLCKQEIENMNGQMWFMSEEGVGTTLSMLLPIWREPEASSTTSSSSQSQSTS